MADPFANDTISVTGDVRQGDAQDLARLTITQGITARPNRPIRDKVFTIGRDPQCDLVLGDDQFPEIHSYLWFRDEEVRLRALAPEPLLTVNGQEVTEAVTLCSGDRIRTGPYQWVIQIENGSPGGGSRRTAGQAKRVGERDPLPFNPLEEGLDEAHRLIVEIRARLMAERPATQKQPSSAA